MAGIAVEAREEVASSRRPSMHSRFKWASLCECRKSPDFAAGFVDGIKGFAGKNCAVSPLGGGESFLIERENLGHNNFDSP